MREYLIVLVLLGCAWTKVDICKVCFCHQEHNIIFCLNASFPEIPDLTFIPPITDYVLLKGSSLSCEEISELEKAYPKLKFIHDCDSLPVPSGTSTQETPSFDDEKVTFIFIISQNYFKEKINFCFQKIL
jgi:hypothetical protein